jgi:uncharacterized protein
MSNSGSSQNSNPRRFRLDPLILNLFGLIAISVVVAGFFLKTEWDRRQIYHLTLAAGSAQGESFAISQALATVTQRYYPNIQIKVLETGGTSANLTKLEKGEADLITAQSDVAIGSRGRSLAVLFDDKFQLLVQSTSNINSFRKLQGKRIALPRSGGQYNSFLAVAQHHGLGPDDFIFVGDTEKASDAAFIAGQADAIFRVRAVGNPNISKLLQGGKANFIPVEQAAALKLKFPALETSMIPRGAYQGSPSIPANDLDTVAVPRVLIANADLDEEVARNITSILFEHRREMADSIPNTNRDVQSLVATSRPPTPGNALDAAIHPGAKLFYKGDSRSFIEKNADVLGIMITIALLLGSWLKEVGGLLTARQKNRADEYGKKVIVLLEQARNAQNTTQLEAITQQLLDILTQAVKALDEDALSEESFQSFRVIWQIANEVSKDRKLALGGRVR